MPKKLPVEKQVKQCIAKLSAKDARKLLFNLTMSYLDGARQENSQDIAEFINSDLTKLIPKLDKLIDQYVYEGHIEMIGDD